MSRKCTHAIASLGLVCAVFGVGCGSGATQIASIPDGASTGSSGGSDATNSQNDSGSGSSSGGGEDATTDAGDDGSGDASGVGMDGTPGGGEGGEAGPASDGGGADAGPDVGSSGSGSGSGSSSGSDSGSGSGSSSGSSSSSGSGADATTDGSSSGGGPDAAAPDAGVDAGVDSGTCSFTGTWGSQIVVNVSWGAGGLGGIIVAAGSGTIKQWILSARTQNGTTVTDSAVVCGIGLPDFSGTGITGGEMYGIRFPNSLFDNAYLPAFTVNGTVTSLTPGATYTSTATATLLGLTLANATTVAWPATITTQVDQDQDTKPGVTANVAQGTGFSNVPLDILKSARADKLYLAIRQVTQISATVTDCNRVTGSVTIPQLPSGGTKYAIDSHIIGCHVAGGGDCTTTGANSQASFVDTNQPVFVPAQSTFESLRMTAGATCAAVRAQFP